MLIYTPGFFEMVILNSTSILQFLNIVLDILHILLMAFIALGWLVPKFRKAHLIVLLLTGSSWLIFSNGNGIMNCILTDLHYEVLRKLGVTNLPETYTQYAIRRITGIVIQKNMAMAITRISWLILLGLSSFLFFKNARLKRKLSMPE